MNTTEVASALQAHWATFWHSLTVELPVKPGLDLLNRDLPLLGGAVAAWTLVHMFLIYFVIRPLGRYWVIPQARYKKLSAFGKPLDKPTPTDAEYLKFETAAWKFLVYASMFTFGCFVLWNQPWFLKNELQAKNWPSEMPFWIEVYYIVTMAQYIHASIVIFWQPKQSDFVEMMVHHMATLLLMSCSYVSAWYDIGATIIIATDAADPWMEFGKCLLYGGHTAMSDLFFFIFSSIFIVTRVILFPKYCISVAYVANKGEPVPWWMFNIFFVFVLYGIFLFWTSLILRMAYSIYFKGEADRGDVRDQDEVAESKKKR